MKNARLIALCFLLSASFGYCSENRYSEIAKKVADEMSQPEKTYTITEKQLDEIKASADWAQMQINIALSRDNNADESWSIESIKKILSEIKQREQDKIEKERKEKVNSEWERINALINSTKYLKGNYIILEEYENLKSLLKEIEARDKEREGIK
jgi:vacuolar-type H+-ATPase subunit I/STV1